MHVLVTCKYEKDQIKWSDLAEIRTHLIKIGQLASEIFKFESVDDDGRRTVGIL